MESIPGTYALVLENKQAFETDVGRFGILSVKPGYYIYVGSAFGPGGVKARVKRHGAREKSLHWHIDYLSVRMRLVNTCYTYRPEKLEHEWATKLLDVSELIPVEGFGCSDCGCRTHLFFTANGSAVKKVRDKLNAELTAIS